MRRGTIAIGKDAGRLCGWNMLAGSILVFGCCGREFGAGMTRGTIVLAGETEHAPLPTFSRGGNYQGTMFRIMATWLIDNDFSPAEKLLERDFQMFHGDTLNGGRGEVFVASPA